MPNRPSTHLDAQIIYVEPHDISCDALMPRNNLSEHLKWLLSEKPYVPPAISLVSYDPDAPASSTSVSLHNSFSADPVPNEVPAPAAPRSTTQPISHPTNSAPPTVDIVAPLPREETPKDMARLRATPSNGRPRLVLAEIPPHGSPSRTPSRSQRTLGSEGELRLFRLMSI